MEIGKYEGWKLENTAANNISVFESEQKEIRKGCKSGFYRYYR